MVDSASMAADWSALPCDILSSLAKILNSDVDLLHLRSVCSYWRSSLPLRPKRFTFPLKVPGTYSPSNLYGSDQRYYLLNQNTLYRLAPPDHGSCAGDSSDGWIFKVSDKAKANTFSLLVPLTTDKIESIPGMVPKHLNLLDYRISEICKSYSLCFVNADEQQPKCLFSKKVIALWNYVADCDLVVLSLCYDGELDYWKFGDDRWYTIHTKKHQKFRDAIFYDGKCYAVDFTGRIVLIDSKLNATVVSSSFGHVTHLLEYNSDLYAVSNLSWSDYEFDFELTPLRSTVFKKIKDDWIRVVNLGDIFFILGSDTSFGVSAKDFVCCKGNFALLIDNCFHNRACDGVYDLDTKRPEGLEKEYAKLFWPPPTWLMPAASSSGQ